MTERSHDRDTDELLAGHVLTLLAEVRQQRALVLEADDDNLARLEGDLLAALDWLHAGGRP
jgi:hypothetical protein